MTNVVGVVFTTNTFLPLLASAATTHSAKVVTISSGMGDISTVLNSGMAQSAPYSISKAAVNLAVAKYAARFKHENIMFVAVSPGLVATAVTPRKFSLRLWSIMVLIVLHQKATPEEMKSYEVIIKYLKAGFPEWDGRPISPETSVKMMLGVVDGLGMKDTGAFISHKGNQEWL